MQASHSKKPVKTPKHFWKAQQGWPARPLIYILLHQSFPDSCLVEKLVHGVSTLACVAAGEPHSLDQASFRGSLNLEEVPSK